MRVRSWGLIKKCDRVRQPGIAGRFENGDGVAGVIGVPSFSVTASGTEGVGPIEIGGYTQV